MSDDFDDWLDDSELFEILDRKVQRWRAGMRLPHNPNSKYGAGLCGMC